VVLTSPGPLDVLSATARLHHYRTGLMLPVELCWQPPKCMLQNRVRP